MRCSWLQPADNVAVADPDHDYDKDCDAVDAAFADFADPKASIGSPKNGYSSCQDGDVDDDY